MKKFRLVTQDRDVSALCGDEWITRPGTIRESIVEEWFLDKMSRSARSEIISVEEIIE